MREERSPRREVFSISDTEQLKAVADPLRQRILGTFLNEPRTTKQVAELLGQPPTRLYHHVDLLERVGLIKLVATKPKRGTTEKYFQAVAGRFTVSGLDCGPEIEDAIATAFRNAEQAIRREAALEETERQSIVALGTMRLTKSQLEKVRKKLESIAQELRSDGCDEEKATYGFLAAVYPSPDSDS